jgi:pyruvate dehydrogenase E1 component beta subunit
MAKKPYAYALLEGLAQEMKRDSTICVNFGQGAELATLATGEILNVAEMFPSPRTISGDVSPIDEQFYVGWCAGMAAAGMKAVTRLPNMAHMVAFEIVWSQVAKMHYGSGGQVNQPVIIWIAGPSRQNGQSIQHTDVGVESMYAYLGGLKVVIPSDAYDGKGLLISALRGTDPVLFLDYSEVATGEQPDVPDEAYVVPIGKAIVRAEGKDMTIAAWAPSTVEVKKALPELTKAGISAEFIDLRTLKPLDTETLFNSVKKTGRLLVVEQGNYTQGFGSHVLAEVAQEVPGAIIRKISFPDAPGPGAAEMIRWMTPDAPKIIDAAQQLVKLTHPPLG